MNSSYLSCISDDETIEEYRLKYPDFNSKITALDDAYRAKLAPKTAEHEKELRRLAREKEALTQDYHSFRLIESQELKQKKLALLDELLRTEVPTDSVTVSETPYDLSLYYPCSLQQYLYRRYLIEHCVPPRKLPPCLDAEQFEELLKTYTNDPLIQSPDCTVTKETMDSFVKDIRFRLFHALDSVLGLDSSDSSETETNGTESEDKKKKKKKKKKRKSSKPLTLQLKNGRHVSVSFENAAFFDWLLTTASDPNSNVAVDDGKTDKKSGKKAGKKARKKAREGYSLLDALQDEKYNEVSIPDINIIYNGLYSLTKDENYGITEEMVNRALIEKYQVGDRAAAASLDRLRLIIGSCFSSGTPSDLSRYKFVSEIITDCYEQIALYSCVQRLPDLNVSPSSFSVKSYHTAPHSHITKDILEDFPFDENGNSPFSQVLDDTL